MPQNVTKKAGIKSSSRRTLLKGAAASGLIAGVAPFAIGQSKPVLRVMGTHVTLQEALRKKASEDLGITIQFEPKVPSA